MPFKARRPMGGFKVMYEYANRLFDLGYAVHITYPLRTKYMEYRLPYFVRKILSYIEGFRTDRWFDFRSGITMSYADQICNNQVSNADIVIATWWSTVLEMGNLNLSKGLKINLIQGYENWIGHIDELHSSYNINNTTNIVVATYLLDIVQKYSQNKTYLIPNAIDSNRYYISTAIESREPYTVCMMYSEQEIKGSEYGLKALIEVKKVYPKLTVELFGICSEPENLPEWIKFYRDPNDITAIYNKNSIFIANSLTEGMALTPMEAMFCGCACILTEIDGHSDYAFDNDTALLYPVKDFVSLIQKLNFLLSDDSQRVLLAKRGNKFIQKFSWDDAVNNMDRIIRDLLIDNKQNEKT